MDNPYIPPYRKKSFKNDIYKTTENINWIVPNPRKKNKTGAKCYTCNPSGAVKKHIIEEGKNFSFHHDMWKRPMIIVTPNTHYHTITDIPAELQVEMWIKIKEFLKKIDIEDYQCLFNNGDWQTHHHFHVKIRFDENTLYELRRKHFEK